MVFLFYCLADVFGSFVLP